MRLAAVATTAVLVIATAAHAADVRAVIAPEMQRIQTADYRATGRLVRVDVSGKRISYGLSIKARWFPGVLRALVQVVPPAVGKVHQDARVSILLETRPNGQDTIRVFHPHEAAPNLLPFDKWDEGLFGGGFSYEDFLEPQYFWQGQTILKSSKFGERDCDVLKSTPGPSDHTHYAEIQTWLDHTIGYPVYVEKTLKEGNIVKEFTYFGLRQSSGVWSAKQVEAKIRDRGGSTLVIIERGTAKANLSIKDFSFDQISQFEDRP